MATPHHRVCGVCGKSVFSSLYEGLAAILRIEWAPRTDVTPVRVYYDRRCGVYHLTSQPQPTRRRPTRRRRPGRAKTRARSDRR